RPDSFLDKISVYSARVRMGTKLGEKIAREWEDLDIDVVIPGALAVAGCWRRRRYDYHALPFYPAR
ncbi:hypothetical protein HZD82_23950, partial [Pantoea agglomerans]|nr:hypothetical protein [Pantoea agglomerans]